MVEPGSGDKVPPYRTPVYLRLVDGGVADNSGLTAMRRALLATGAPADIGRLTAQGKLRHLVVIAVNARSDPQSDLDKSTQYTTLLTMANAISGTLVDSASSNSAAAFQSFIKLLIDDRNTLVKVGQTQANFAVYPISIDFDQLPNATAAERQEQQKVKSIATSWTLQARRRRTAEPRAGELLWRHPASACWWPISDLQGQSEAHPVPGLRCPVEPPLPIPATRQTTAGLIASSPESCCRRGRPHVMLHRSIPYRKATGSNGRKQLSNATRGVCSMLDQTAVTAFSHV